MKILQFAFDGGEDNPYLPHNHERMSIVYTGTHDNDTTLGWFDSLDESGKEQVNYHLAKYHNEMPWSRNSAMTGRYTSGTVGITTPRLVICPCKMSLAPIAGKRFARIANCA